LVADELVDDVRGSPQGGDVDVALEPETVQRLCEGLARDTMERQRDRVDGARYEVGTGARGFERGRERVACSALAVDADLQSGRRAEPGDGLGRAVGLERAGRVVQQHARRAERRQLARLLDEGGRLAGPPGAVDETCLELRPRVRNGGGRFSEVRDVVERVVE